MKYLNFNSDKLPSIASFTLRGEKLTFLLRYNYQMEKYTLDLFDSDGSAIVIGRVLAYGREALTGVAHVHACGLGVMPFDALLGKMAEGVTRENFMDDVLPYIVLRFE